MDRLSSSASTASNIDDYSEHNMWNPLLELLFLEQFSDIFAYFVVEIDLAKIALSCHFALDILCHKEGAYDPTLYTVQDRNILEKLFKPVLHSTTCTRGTSCIVMDKTFCR